MLSRVAEAMFWMSRYVERSENVARFVDVNLHLSLDFPEASAQWLPLVQASGDLEAFRARYPSSSDGADPAHVMEFLTFDRTSPNSILSCLARARENARSIREIISSEMWEQVNQAYLTVKEASRAGIVMDSPHDFFTAVKQASQLFVGITDLTMTHNEGWHFGRLGRLLERADKTSRILDLRFLGAPDPLHETAFDELHWSAQLRSCSALEMYRKRHGHIKPAKVVEFLLLNDRFPRSVRFCLAKAERSLHAITGTPAGEWSTVVERELGKLNAELAYADTKEMTAKSVHRFIDDLQARLNLVGDAVFRQFFAIKADDGGDDAPPASPRALAPLSTRGPSQTQG